MKTDSENTLRVLYVVYYIEKNNKISLLMLGNE